jgi:UDP-glucose 4-epimerase
MSMKVLITGGAGFIGSHTVVELVNAGYEPVIVDNFSNSKRSVITSLEKLLDQKIPLHVQDYADTKALSKIIKSEDISAVIHFAAFKKVGESVEEPLKYYANNVSGLISLLELVKDVGIKHFVFSSSCTVYGEPGDLPVTEDTPLQPAVSPYGATKQIGEAILHDTTVASKSLNAISLRYFNPIGAHPSGLIGELPLGIPANLVPFITQTAAGLRKSLVVYGNDYPTPDGSVCSS